MGLFLIDRRLVQFPLSVSDDRVVVVVERGALAEDLFFCEEVLRTAVSCAPLPITESVIIAVVVRASGLTLVKERVTVQLVRESNLESVYKLLNAILVD